MGDRQRQQFLNDIIEELESQLKYNPSAMTSERKLSEDEVFRKLCFDFPQIQNDDILCLTRCLHDIVEAKPSGFLGCFYINNLFLENCTNGSSNHQNNNSSSYSALSAVIFLEFPEYLLKCDKKTISKLLLFADHECSWFDICQRFCDYQLLGKQVHFDKDAVAGNQIGFLIRIIFQVGSFVVHSQKALETLSRTANETSFDLILKQAESMNSCESFLTFLKEELAKLAKNPGSEQIIESSENHSLCRTFQAFKDLWVHHVLLCRDILIRVPELVPRYFQQLCDMLILLQVQANVVLERSQFPGSLDCLYVLIVSNVSAYLTSYNEFDEPSRAAAELQAMMSARGAIRSYLQSANKQGLVKLTKFVGACCQMQDYKLFVQPAALLDVDSIGYLLDAAALYAFDVRGGCYTGATSSMRSMTAASQIDLLLANGVIAALANSWMVLLSLSLQLFSGTMMQVPGNNTSVLAAIAARLSNTMSVLVWNSSSLCDYLLSFPGLLESMQAISGFYGELDAFASSNPREVLLPAAYVAAISITPPVSLSSFCTAAMVNLFGTMNSRSSASAQQLTAIVASSLRCSMLLLKYSVPVSDDATELAAGSIEEAAPVLVSADKVLMDKLVAAVRIRDALIWQYVLLTNTSMSAASMRSMHQLADSVFKSNPSAAAVVETHRSFVSHASAVVNENIAKYRTEDSDQAYIRQSEKLKRLFKSFQNAIDAAITNKTD